ncbi:MAG TPA: DUF1653 domain-containing protein [Rariglobus sp.]|nr:DUF1653 domain-containing protein [Rariglobus sp.]
MPDASVPPIPVHPAGPQPGRYRHYKGKEYLVLGVAKHSETEEELVTYRLLYGDYGLWVRPRAMFLETIELDGQSMPRFAYVGPA